MLLRYNSGPHAGAAVPVNKSKVTFGRGVGCDCLLKHPTVSREHFCIERTGGKYFAVDQDSGNGTFVNGERISWVELKPGDRIQAGPFSFVVEASDEDQPPMKTPGAVDDPAGEGHSEQGGPGGPLGFDAAHRELYPREYLEGVDHFNARRYYEAHEVWEEIWLRSSGETKLFYQMLIQSAVGLHHYERGNARGGRGMHKAVTEKLSRLPGVYMSLDLEDFSRQFQGYFAALVEGDESPPPHDRPRPLIRLAGVAE
jgi:pSer/pThr/pTyr-binding forkhead associated (FHA) protein